MQPPDAYLIRIVNDYTKCFQQMTLISVPQPSTLNSGSMAIAHDLAVMFDTRSGHRTNQSDLNQYAGENPLRDPDQGVILLASYGVNGDEDNNPAYLLTGGSDGGAILNLVNGAVFTSIESFNAVTMFSNVATQPVPQGKLIDFIQIGGAAAIGHGFEPQSIAAIDNEFLFYNLLADSDGDGRADLSFVEAAFTSIPFLSWAEVVIGDPLMRIAYGPGGRAWQRLDGDGNNDGRVNFLDLKRVRDRLGAQLNTTNQDDFDLYHDLYDFNKDGRINFLDLLRTKKNLGATSNTN